MRGGPCMCGDSFRCQCGNRDTRWHNLTPEQKNAAAKRCAKYKAKNPELYRQRSVNNHNSKFLENPKRFRAISMLKSAIKRAKNSGIYVCNLKLQDILEVFPDKCPVFGNSFLLEIGQKNGPKDNSPTLDRIIPSKGYVKENIWVISFRANRIKNDATIEELRIVAHATENALNAKHKVYLEDEKSGAEY